jgi:hypothetical protein
MKTVPLMRVPKATTGNQIHRSIAMLSNNLLRDGRDEAQTGRVTAEWLVESLASDRLLRDVVREAKDTFNTLDLNDMRNVPAAEVLVRFLNESEEVFAARRARQAQSNGFFSIVKRAHYGQLSENAMAHANASGGHDGQMESELNSVILTELDGIEVQEIDLDAWLAEGGRV